MSGPNRPAQARGHHFRRARAQAEEQTEHLGQLLEQVRLLLERESDQTDLIVSLAAQTVEMAHANQVLIRAIHAHTVGHEHPKESDVSNTALTRAVTRELHAHTLLGREPSDMGLARAADARGDRGDAAGTRHALGGDGATRRTARNSSVDQGPPNHLLDGSRHHHQT
jgi:hypothetical protein